MKPLKQWEPIFYSNSKVPVWLSSIPLVPINIYAISFGWGVWSRGELEVDKWTSKAGKASCAETRRHETIHFQQQLELLFVFQWILYGLFYLIGLVRYRNGEQAYRENPFEREAYGNDKDQDYLLNRPRYSWVRYIL